MLNNISHLSDSDGSDISLALLLHQTGATSYSDTALHAPQWRYSGAETMGQGIRGAASFFRPQEAWGIAAGEHSPVGKVGDAISVTKD